MKKILLFIVFFVVLLTPIKTLAFNYDVSWLERKPNENHHILAITINDCETRFKIKNEDFYSFAKKEKVIEQALDKAIERVESGCR